MNGPQLECLYSLPMAKPNTRLKPAALWVNSTWHTPQNPPAAIHTLDFLLDHNLQHSQSALHSHPCKGQCIARSQYHSPTPNPDSVPCAPICKPQPQNNANTTSTFNPTFLFVFPTVPATASHSCDIAALPPPPTQWLPKAIPAYTPSRTLTQPQHPSTTAEP